MSSLSAFGKQRVAAGVGRFTDLVLAKGEGSYVTTDEGRVMLDFSAGIGVTNLGHCHPKVTKAAQDQCATLVHGQVNIGFNKPYLGLIEKLLPVMPDKSLDTFFFWNSGAEAVEASIKLARMATGKQNIVVVQGSYHGRTFGTMAMTKSKTVYGEGFGPLMPGVFTTAFPYWHQMGVEASTSEEVLVTRALHEMELLLKQQSAPSDTACVIIEPVLGEGGYIPAPKSYMEGLRKICDKNNLLLIADEVQSGFGRTGKYFAMEHYPGVVPDIMVMAKGIANGFPLSGIVSRKELMDKQKAGSMGGTYAGNAVACAAGIACAEVMQEEKILDNVAARSKQLLAALDKIKQSPAGDLIAEIRGLGLMIGIEFKSPTSPYTPGSNIPSKIASRVQAKCLEKDMLTLTTSVFETIRFIPPLTISEEEMAKGCEIFTAAMNEVAKEASKWVDQADCYITNMEGAMHTWVTAVVPILQHGDYIYRGGHSVLPFPSVNGYQQARPVVLSTTIHPDFESDQVFVALTELGNEAVHGENLYQFELLPHEGKRNTTARLSCDRQLRAHLVYHLTASHRLPALSDARQVWSVSQALGALESVIDSSEVRSSPFVDAFVRTRFGKVLSLEMLANTYIASLVNEFSVLNYACPRGFVYTFDPPSIFAYALDAELLNRLMILALKAVLERQDIPTLRVFAFNDFADPDAIPLLKRVCRARPHIKVLRRSMLYGAGHGYLDRAQVPDGCTVVIHNNSDAFGE